MPMTKYTVKPTTKFKKDYKRVRKQGRPMEEMKAVVDLLADGKPLPDKYDDHDLTGNWIGYRECHIRPDWLLIYKCMDDVLILSLTRTGSHDELFEH